MKEAGFEGDPLCKESIKLLYKKKLERRKKHFQEFFEVNEKRSGKAKKAMAEKCKNLFKNKISVVLGLLLKTEGELEIEETLPLEAQHSIKALKIILDKYNVPLTVCPIFQSKKAPTSSSMSQTAPSPPYQFV